MALFTRKRDTAPATATASAGIGTNPFPHDVALSPVRWPDTFGIAITRDMAMSIPAAARARNLICGTIAGAPLTEWQGTTRLDTRTLLHQPDPDVARMVTLAWTVDDLIWHGRSYWLVLERAADATNGARPLRARRVDPLKVVPSLFDERKIVAVDGVEVDPADVIAFDGPHEGVLHYGARELRVAYALSEAARRFASIPMAALELHDLSEDGLSTKDRDALIADWIRAREAGGVAYTNKSLELKDHGWNSRDLQLVEARAHQAIEVARVMNTPAAMLDAGVSGSSIEYANMVDRRRDFVDFSCAPYVDAVEARLSMDDLTERGRYVAFDLEARTLRANLADRLAAYETAIGLDLMTVDEARNREAGRPGQVAP